MYYSGIKHCDIVNGSGIRVTLFVSGCSNNCKNCHNPETHNENYGTQFSLDTLNEITNELKEKWCSGLTLCGGDPLYKNNIKTVHQIVSYVKEKFPHKDIWMYTGYTLNKVLNMADNDIHVYGILNNIDFILDGPYIEKLKSFNKPWVGSSNQHIYKIDHIDTGGFSFTKLDK